MSDFYTVNVPVWSNTLMERMQMLLHDSSADDTVVELPLEGNTQTAGFLHGGASAALIETAASHAAFLHARTVYGDGAYAVGVELSVSHLRPGAGASVRAHAHAVHLGKTSTVHTVTVYDEQGRAVSSGRVTNRIFPPAQS